MRNVGAEIVDFINFIYFKKIITSFLLFTSICQGRGLNEVSVVIGFSNIAVYLTVFTALQKIEHRLPLERFWRQTSAALVLVLPL